MDVYKRYANRDRDFPKRRGHCRYCGKYARLVYCSPKCKMEVDIRCGWYADDYIFKRDKGVCHRCGLDTLAVSAELHRLNRVQKTPSWLSTYTTWSDFIVSGGFPRLWHEKLWRGHHIKPIYLGGGCCGIENYETLCWLCHNKEHESRENQKGMGVAKGGLK
jgi:hypothetical protein